MANQTFEWGQITINVDMETGQVSVQGPKAFTSQINWDQVYSSAKVMASYSPSLAHAIAHGVNNQWASWKGARSIGV